MNGVFTPQPGSAPLRRQVRTQAAMETRLMLRNGEQLLLAVVIPVLVLIGGVVAGRHLDLSLSRPLVDVLTPGVLALAVMSTAFTSLAIATGFERRYGVLKRLGSSPLPRHGLLLGKVGALLVMEALQVVVLCAVGVGLGWRPDLAGIPAALLFMLLGTAAFGALGLALAGVLRAEATLAAANLVYLLLMAGGGVVLPTTAYGDAHEALRWLPSGALGNALRETLLSGGLDLHAVLVLVLWAALGTAAVARWFRWE